MVYSRPEVVQRSDWRNICHGNTLDLRPHENLVSSSCHVLRHSYGHICRGHWKMLWVIEIWSESLKMKMEWERMLWKAYLWVAVLHVQEVQWISFAQDCWHSFADFVLIHQIKKTTFCIDQSIKMIFYLECLPTKSLFLSVPLMYGLPVSIFWKSIIPPGT